MKIGILETGRPPIELINAGKSYPDLFATMLSGHGFEFTPYWVEGGEIPTDATEQDGWLITGSRHGAYEDHAFIPPLEDLIREIYAQGQPMIGVCFGHQIIAQALGGKVEKFVGGWSIGPTTYTETNGSSLSVIAFHQDQVIEKPSEARVLASSDFCKYAALAYGDKVLTIQPHPEFDDTFVRDLITLRRDVLPQKESQDALEHLSRPLNTDRVAEQFARHFKQFAPATT